MVNYDLVPTEKDKRQFGYRLYNAIAESKKTQRKVAKEVGITQPQVNHYLKGKTYPSVEALVRLCRALNVTPNYLLGFVDNTALVAEAKADGEERAFLFGLYDMLFDHLFDEDGNER